MKIRINETGEIVDVFVFYWSKNVRHHMVLMDNDSQGFLTVTENSSEIIDSHVENYYLRKGNNSDVFLHWAVIEDDLVDKLIEREDFSVDELKRRLAAGVEKAGLK